MAGRGRFAKVARVFLDNVLWTSRLEVAFRRFQESGVLGAGASRARFGLPLSYVEDRLVAALQALMFESHSYGARARVPKVRLSAGAREVWGWDGSVPVLAVDRDEFVWACLLGADQRIRPLSAKWVDHKPSNDKILRVFKYLEELHDRVFEFAFWPPGEGEPRLVRSTLFSMRYAFSGARRKGIEIALSPLFLVNVYAGFERPGDGGSHFFPRPLDFYRRLEGVVNRRGARSALLPRLYYACLMKPSTDPWRVDIRTLARELRVKEPTTRVAQVEFCDLVEENLVILERAKVFARRPRFDAERSALLSGSKTGE